MEKIISYRLDDAPPIIERLCSNTNYYNFNITSRKYIEDEELTDRDEYICEQVLVTNPVTKEKIKESMINSGYNIDDYIKQIESDCLKLGIE
jgi:hypothetical protein